MLNFKLNISNTYIAFRELLIWKILAEVSIFAIFINKKTSSFLPTGRSVNHIHIIGRIIGLDKWVNGFFYQILA